MGGHLPEPIVQMVPRSLRSRQLRSQRLQEQKHLADEEFQRQLPGSVSPPPYQYQRRAS